MSVAGVRTLVVSALAAVVAVRASTQPPAGAYARIAADPAGALRSAADGWTVSGTLGDATAQGLREVPVAAFLWLADVLRLPPAGGRAAWSVLVLVVAVVGAVRLARARAGGEAGPERAEGEPWTPWVAAALFACAPVLVTTVQHSPGDGLVVALLPWVLGPLVRREDGWRAAAWSAVWLGLAGAGTPPWAVAALAAGVVTAVVTSRRPRGGRQLLRWSVLALASSSWWIAAYAWEAAYATDVAGLAPTDLSTTLLAEALGLPGGGAWWAVVLMLAPSAVVVLAFALRAPGDLVPAGALLALAAAAAVLGAVTGGWPAWLPLPASVASATDTVQTPWAVLAAWVGLAALLAWTPLVEHLSDRVPRAAAWEPSARTGVVVAALAVVAVTSAGPVLAAQEEPAEIAVGDAEAWARVAAWSATAPPGRVLVLPAVADGRVEPAVVDALRGRPWISRDTLPLSGPAATSALDAALGRLSRGHDGPGTAAALRHLGVSYVLLRNDVTAAADRDRPVALVRHALVRQGASRVAVVRGAGDGQDASGIVDLGVRDPAGSLEIWALDEASEGTVHEGDPLTVSGAPGVVADLADAGLAPEAALRLGRPAEGAPGTVSDSARRQDVDQRVPTDPYGPLLDEAQAPSVRPAGAAPTPTASGVLSGALAVRASSSAADLDGSRRRTGAVPTAAVDGNAFTAWQSRRGTVTGQWWEITFDGATDLTGGTLQVLQNAFSTSLVTRVRLESDSGSTEMEVPPDGLVGVGAAGRTERLRVVATAVSGTPDATRSFGITELSLAGLAVRQDLAVDGQDADTWVLAARPSSFATCVPSYPLGGPDDPAANETVCNRGVAVDGPDPVRLSRVLRTERGGEVAGRVWMRAADSSQSSALAEQLASPSLLAEGSSSASSDLVSGPQAAADADPATGWRPSPDDEAPTLDLSWDRSTRVTGLRVTTAERQLSTRPTHVVVSYGDGTESATGEIGDDGVVELPPVRTRSLSVTFEAETQQTSLDSFTAGTRPVPMTVSEVEVLGGPDVAYDADDVEELPCGSGPDVSVDGESYETAVRASARQVVEAAVLTATLCERPELRAGEVAVSIDASFSWIPLGLVLAAPGSALGTVDQPASGAVGAAAGVPAGTVDAADGADLEVDGPATVTLAVPAGTGWTAVSDGQELPSLTVDGWAQAWQAPVGTSRLSLRYSAVEELRVAAGAAALGWLAVLLLAAVPSRSRTRLPRP